jgi:MFS family permease
VAQLPSKNVTNQRAFAALIAGRIVYATNYYNVAAVFSFIAIEFSGNVGGLGLLSSGFLLGIGLFQVPGGIMAAKLGPRRVAIYGTTITSVASLLSGFAPNLTEMAILRFFVGLGMALVFSPGVALITRIYRRGSEGLAVGIYNSTFWVGGVLGLAGWAAIAQAFGWRSSLIIDGILGLGTVLPMILFIPPDVDTRGFGIQVSDLRQVLLQRTILVIGLSLLGLNIGLTIVGQFATFYLVQIFRIVPQTAALLASLTGISSVVSGLVSGRVYDKLHRLRLQFLVSIGGVLCGLLAAATGTLAGIVLSTILVGGFSGIGQTVAFAAARETNRVHPRYESLAVSWVNGIQFTGGSWIPIVFSSVALSLGYSVAWLSICVFVIGLSLPLFLFKLPVQDRTSVDQTEIKTASD